MGETMQGTRLPDADMGVSGGGWEQWACGGEPCPAGVYMKVVDSDFPDHKPVWYIKDPAGQIGTLGPGHQVTEHEDGTITVSPSIWDAPNGWHGWLERGVWRSV